MVSVSCFGVRVSVMFHLICLFIKLLVQFVLLSCHRLGNSCPLGKLFVLIVFCLFVIFIYFRFGFESGICLWIAQVPVHCFSITFTSSTRENHCLRYVLCRHGRKYPTKPVKSILQR